MQIGLKVDVKKERGGRKREFRRNWENGEWTIEMISLFQRKGGPSAYTR